MKISYISVARVPSRTANSIHVMKMAQAFVMNGHDLSLFVQESNDDIEGKGDFLRFYGVDVDLKVSRVKAVPLIKEYGLALKQVCLAAKLKPALIYTRDIPSAYFAAKTGYPVILELHSPVSGSVKRMLLRAIIRSNRFLGMVVVTKSLKEHFCNNVNYPIADDNIMVEPDAVDYDRFSNLLEARSARQHLGFPDSFTVGYSGHLYPGRGIELILDLAKRLSDINFIIVGGNPESVQYYQAQIDANRLTNISLIGFVPNSEVSKYLACCDLLAMPYQAKVVVSGGGDNAKWMSPMKLFEYMATGRTILASKLGVIQEILSGDNALLCDPLDVSSWEEKIRWAIKNPSMSCELAQKAREDVKEHTWQKRAERILDRFILNKVTKV